MNKKQQYSKEKMPPPEHFIAPDGTVFFDETMYLEYINSIAGFSFENKVGERLVKKSGEINGQPFDLRNLKDCEVLLLDYTDMIVMDNCVNCKVVVAASGNGGLCLDSRCRGCEVSAALANGQCRLSAGCTDITLRLRVEGREPGVMLEEGCSGVKIGPLPPIEYPEYKAHLCKAGFAPVPEAPGACSFYATPAAGAAGWLAPKEQEEGEGGAGGRRAGRAPWGTVRDMGEDTRGHGQEPAYRVMSAEELAKPWTLLSADKSKPVDQEGEVRLNSFQSTCELNVLEPDSKSTPKKSKEQESGLMQMVMTGAGVAVIAGVVAAFMFARKRA